MRVGWWDSMIGPGRAFDTDRCHVVCTNLLGGCRGSTGPSSIDPAHGRPYGSELPAAHGCRPRPRAAGVPRRARDPHAALRRRQRRSAACRRSSSRSTTRSSCAASSRSPRRPSLDTQGVALNAVARNAITSDPDWQAGDYYGTGRAPRAGLALARQVGHITYLSKDSLREKFPGDRFAVESYLAYQGEKFVERFDANTYLLMSRALTRFDLPPARLRDARARFLLLSFTSDWIYPPSDSADLAAALEAAGRTCEHVTFETTYGHDSFLLEDELQAPYIRRFLERTYEETR